MQLCLCYLLFYFIINGKCQHNKERRANNVVQYYFIMTFQYKNFSNLLKSNLSAIRHKNELMNFAGGLMNASC